jgi:hypothetical protein
MAWGARVHGGARQQVDVIGFLAVKAFAPSEAVRGHTPHVRKPPFPTRDAAAETGRAIRFSQSIRRSDESEPFGAALEGGTDDHTPRGTENDDTSAVP